MEVDSRRVKAGKVQRIVSMKHGSAIGGLVAGLVFVVVMVGLLFLFGLDEQVLRLLNWLDGQGAWAPVLFVLVMAVVVVLVLPGVLFTTGAGFVFGVVKGTVCVVIGTTLGAVAAFLIARHLFGERAGRYVLEHPKLKRLGEGLAPEGWKVVLLTRLVPFFPFKLSNYFFGLTPLSLRSFAIGTFFGIVPYSLHNVYIGSIASDLAMLGMGGQERTPLEWGIYGAGFLVAVGAVIYLNRLAHRALADYREEDGKE